MTCSLAEYLDDADLGCNLPTCTHLVPQSQDKAKRAVDGVFERLGDARTTCCMAQTWPRSPADLPQQVSGVRC